MWDKGFFTANNIVLHRSFILMEGVISNNFNCCVVNIYAPNEVNDRSLLWEELLVLKSNLGLPWCIGGYFNEIRAILEKGGMPEY